MENRKHAAELNTPVFHAQNFGPVRYLMCLRRESELIHLEVCNGFEVFAVNYEPAEFLDETKDTVQQFKSSITNGTVMIRQQADQVTVKLTDSPGQTEVILSKLDHDQQKKVMTFLLFHFWDRLESLKADMVKPTDDGKSLDVNDLVSAPKSRMSTRSKVLKPGPGRSALNPAAKRKKVQLGVNFD